jgi:hypothetical protein
MSDPFALRPAKLVTFGHGGDTVYYGHGTVGSGYGTPENPHAATNIPDGTPALDKRPAIDTPAGYSFVFKGPMVNPDLDPGEVSKCPDLSDNIMVRAMLETPGNQFGTLAALQMIHDKPTPGPLDSVDTETYCQLWQNLGARRGVYQNGLIHWQN